MKSRPPSSSPVVVALLASAVAVTIASCGIKSPPLPPVIRVADPTRDLTVHQEGGEAVLSWSYPASTTAGDPLSDLESVEVWRSTMLEVEAPPPAENARDRAINLQLLEADGEPVAVLDRAGLDAATRGSKLEWRDNLDEWRRENPADEPQMLWYSVRSVCCRGRRSAPSNVARLVPETPPTPPTDLVAEPDAKGIRLRWVPHDELPVNVERSSDGELWQVVAESRPATGDWLDGGAPQGTSWSYRLRSVQRRSEENLVIGEPGPSVGLFYPDIYPPAAPADLVCLPEGARVRLRWQAVAEGEVYRVRRRVGSGDPKILADELRSTQFEDQAPPPGALDYEVTAVDAVGNESDPATCTAISGAAS